MDVSTYPKINQNYKRGDYAECITLKAIEQRGYYIDLTESSRTNWTAQDEVKHSLKVN